MVTKLKTKNPKLKTLLLLILMLMLAITAGCRIVWQDKLTQNLSVMGHRNWIVVADSAYPAQNRPGIETIATGEDQVETVKTVLKAVDDANHVRPIVYVDRELKSVSEADAPGIDAYRRELAWLLRKRAVRSIPHEESIAKLDEAAKTFRVLILKTNMTLPYTSVFFELDCGYWSAGAEKRLRDKMSQSK
jgi:L-fucose mutarotase/ribose pyranase (RbsD/FucU family)